MGFVTRVATQYRRASVGVATTRKSNYWKTIAYIDVCTTANDTTTSWLQLKRMKHINTFFLSLAFLRSTCAYTYFHFEFFSAKQLLIGLSAHLCVTVSLVVVLCIACVAVIIDFDFDIHWRYTNSAYGQ